MVKKKINTKMDFITAITPGIVTNARNNARTGNLYLSSQIHNLMMGRDLRLRGVMETRLNALYKTDIAIINGNEFLTTLITENKEKLLRFSLLSRLMYIDVLQFTDEELFFYFDKNLPLKIDDETNELFYENEKGNYEKLSPDQFYWVYTSNPLLDSIIDYHIAKRFAFSNWVSLTEIYGKPARVGRYSPGATDKEKEELWDMVSNAGNDLAMMISDNVKLEFVDLGSKVASAELYENLINSCNTEITIAILGQTMTTIDGSSYSQANVHDRVRGDILSSDVKIAQSLINDLILKMNESYPSIYPKANVEVSIPEPVVKD